MSERVLGHLVIEGPNDVALHPEIDFSVRAADPRFDDVTRLEVPPTLRLPLDEQPEAERRRQEPGDALNKRGWRTEGAARSARQEHVFRCNVAELREFAEALGGLVDQVSRVVLLANLPVDAKLEVEVVEVSQAPLEPWADVR